MNLDLILLACYIIYTVILFKFLQLNNKNMSVILKLKAENLKLKQNELANNTTMLEDMHKENFIKFISESRDFAYKYIEDVQNSINVFVTEIEPEINYFKQYGDTISMEPNYNSLKKITKAYDELKKILPEDKP